MFGRELLPTNPFVYNNANNLDPEFYIQNNVNNRTLVQLLRERLLKIREKRNNAKSSYYRSYPRGSLILIKDFRPKIHKKLIPVFFKLPQKVVTEYKCTVLAEDLFGRICKHSKNNIRLMSPRSKELFSKLPTEIKMIMGVELDENEWNKIRETGIIPLYLQDIEIQAELGRMTRGNVPKDTHMVQDGNNAPYI
jgi:hypothetical protein